MPMLNLPAVQKFSRAPALLSAAHAHELLALAHSPERNEEITARHLEQLAATYGVEPPGQRKPFMFAGGVAVIPVWGALLHRDPWCSSYATGYDYIASRFAAAMADDDVKGIVFDVNSYGGHVSGNFELAEMIREGRERKPSMAIVDSRSLSGGYSLASAAGKMYATPSADVGSIGVVLTHVSYEDMLKNDGVEITFIFAGDHKVDGNPYQALSEDVKAALQGSVSRSYEQFVSLVSENRGLDAEAVRATQARVYSADEALSLKLVDAVMPARAAYAAFLSELNAGSKPSPKEAKKNMTTETVNKKAGGEGEEEITRADVDQARQQGAAEQQQRIAGILNCEDAKGRESLANHIAFNTSMSADEAQKMLAASPKQSAEAPAAPNGNRLASAMEPDTNKTVGVDGGDAGADDSKKGASRLLAARQKAGGAVITKQ